MELSKMLRGRRLVIVAYCSTDSAFVFLLAPWVGSPSTARHYMSRAGAKLALTALSPLLPGKGVEAGRMTLHEPWRFLKIGELWYTASDHSAVPRLSTPER